MNLHQLVNFLVRTELRIWRIAEHDPRVRTCQKSNMAVTSPVDVTRFSTGNSAKELSEKRTIQKDEQPDVSPPAEHELQSQRILGCPAPDDLAADSDDLVLRLMERCQVDSNSEQPAPDVEHTIAVSVKDARRVADHVDACANPRPRHVTREESQNAVSITNFDIPGCMEKATEAKQRRRADLPKALKVTNRRKVNRGRRVEAPSGGGSAKLRYYDFSARSLGDMPESRDYDAKPDPEGGMDHKGIADDRDPERSLKAPEKVVVNRFDLRRLLKLFDKGSVPESAWDAYRMSTRRGQLQDGRLHRPQKDADQSALKHHHNHNNKDNINSTRNINRMLLSVTGRRYQELSTRERLTVLSSYYQTKVKAENTWSSACGKNLSRTPGEMAILLGRAMNKKQVGFYRKEQAPSGGDHQSSSTGMTSSSSSKRTCHISVHLPVIQREPCYDARQLERDLRADHVTDGDTCLDVEGHFPPTIDRHVSRIGKLVSGCRARNNPKSSRPQPSDDDVIAAEMNIVKLPIISPEGSVTSGGLIRRQNSLIQNDYLLSHQEALDDCLPDAPPGTPVSLSSRSLWPSSHGALDIMTSLRRSSIHDVTVTPFSSLAAIADEDQFTNEKWDLPTKLDDLQEYVDHNLDPGRAPSGVLGYPDDLILNDNKYHRTDVRSVTDVTGVTDVTYVTDVTDTKGITDVTDVTGNTVEMSNR